LTSLSEPVTAARRRGRLANPLGVPLRAMRRWPIIPVIVLGTLLFAGAFAPWVAPHNYREQDLGLRHAPPAWMKDGTKERLLGADRVGRDLLSRMIYGARLSIVVASISLISGAMIGGSLGILSGYYGGLADEIIMRAVDVWFAIPFLLLALVVVIVFGPSLNVVLSLLALLSWSGFVRNVRAEALVIRTRDYVAMARIAGSSNLRIIYKHIAPGVLNTVLVIASLQVGGLILAEASLSFLGAGIPSPTPAWGVMVADGRNYLDKAWWESTFPGIAILLAVMSFNFTGDWLRDRMDPRLRQI